MTSESRDKSEPLREEDVQGLKYFGRLGPLLERLHEVGCARDKAGNRQLFMDQYCAPGAMPSSAWACLDACNESPAANCR